MIPDEAVAVELAKRNYAESGGVQPWEWLSPEWKDVLTYEARQQLRDAQ